MDLQVVSEELAFIRSELERLDEAFMEAAQSQYYEKASEFRFEKHKNKLRLHELKYKCLVYLEECEFKWYRWKQFRRCGCLCRGSLIEANAPESNFGEYRFKSNLVVLYSLN